MKKLISFLLSSVLALSVFAVDPFSITGLNGNPKSYETTEYTLTSKFGEYFKTPKKIISNSFDENGNLVEITEYTPRKILISKTTIKYNENNQIAEKNCSTAENEILWKQVYSYKDSVLKDVCEYDSKNVLKAKSIYTYKNGVLHDEAGYDKDGTLLWKNVYKYSDSGKDYAVSNYSADGSLSEAVTYSYKESGDLDSISTYNAFDDKTTKEVLIYNSVNRVSEVATYVEEQLTNRETIKYDSQGNISKLSSYNVVRKFGEIQNELASISDTSYNY